MAQQADPAEQSDASMAADGSDPEILAKIQRLKRDIAWAKAVPEDDGHSSSGKGGYEAVLAGLQAALAQAWRRWSRCFEAFGLPAALRPAVP